MKPLSKMTIWLNHPDYSPVMEMGGRMIAKCHSHGLLTLPLSPLLISRLLASNPLSIPPAHLRPSTLFLPFLSPPFLSPFLFNLRHHFTLTFLRSLVSPMGDRAALYWGLCLSKTQRVDVSMGKVLCGLLLQPLYLPGAWWVEREVLSMIYKTGSLTALQYINHWRSPRGCWTYTYDNTDSLSFYVSFALSFPLFSLFLSLSIYLFFISPLYNFLSYCQLFCHDSVSPLSLFLSSSLPIALPPPPPLFLSG